MMPDGLYERDALAWSIEQADLLRRLAAGERVNDAVDWPNVIEELEDVGRSELSACNSLMRQALVHLLKLHAWPDSQAVGHWRGEVLTFLSGTRDRFSPSMRQNLDLPDLYDSAADTVRVVSDTSGPPRPLPEQCPLTLDDLLIKRPDVHALVIRFASP